MNTGDFSGINKIVSDILPITHNISKLIGERSNDEYTLFDSEQTVVPGLGMLSEAGRIISRNNDMRDGIFKVLVFGQFSNGKSTLINALLGESTLRAKAVPTTAIITMLVYGDEDTDTVTIFEKQDDSTEATIERSMSWEQFRKEFTLTVEDRETMEKQGFIDRFRNVLHARVARNHTLLRNGVRLIDSPGLGDQTNRTLLATTHLRESQAVLFVLNAMRILNQEEREFIKNELGRGQLTHVFFLINFYNMLEEDEDREELIEFVKVSLRPYFSDEQGYFDEDLYNSRVFFVNAKGALDAKIQLAMGGFNEQDETHYEKTLYDSGMVRFERHLTRFLTSDQKVKAILDTAIDPLVQAIANAQTNIRLQRASLDQDIEQLIENKRIADERLDMLEKEKENILQQVEDEIERIELKIHRSLEDYIKDMQEEWPCDAGLEECSSEVIISLDELRTVDIATSLFNKKRIETIIESQVKNYINVKFEAWAAQVPHVIQGDLDRMLIRIDNRVNDFGVELAEIKNIFAGNKIITVGPNVFGGNQGVNYLQGILGLIAGSPEMVAGSLAGRASFGTIISTYIKRFIGLYLLTTIFTMGFSLIIVAVTELIFASRHVREFRREALQRLGDELFTVGLPRMLSEGRGEMKKTIHDAFLEFKIKLEKELQSQIDETRKEQAHIVDMKKNRQNEVAIEKERLDTISELLLAELNRVYEVGYQRHLTGEQRALLLNGSAPSRI